MTLPHLSRLTRRVRRRMALGLFVAECGAWSSLALYAVGTVVVLGRALGPLPREAWTPALCALAAAPLLALWRMRGRVWSEQECAVWLDAGTGGAGLLVAQAELGGDAAWDERTSRYLARVPDPPTTRFGTALQRVLPAALFCAAALWIELPRPTPTALPTSLLQSLIGRLEGQLGFLENELELDPEVAGELRTRLERLAQGVEAGSSEGLFAALDGIEASLQAEAGRAGDVARSVLERIATQGDGASLAQALGGALETLQESGLANKWAPLFLEQFGDSLGPSLGGDAAQLAQLAELLEGSEFLRERVSEQMNELALRGLVEAPLELPSGWRNLADRLSQGFPGFGGSSPSSSGSGPSGSGEQASAGPPGTGPGGGANPGRDDAEAIELTQRLKLTPLPPGTLDPERSGLLAVQPADPLPGDEPASGEWAGAVDLETGPGASAWRRRLAPGHRRVVRRFFGADPQER